MEQKKSNKANLEKNRGLFFEVGLLVALGFSFLAFEWKVAPKEETSAEGPVQVAIEEEIVPITREQEPPPPPPEPPKVTDILDIVADDVVVDSHIEINIEIDFATEITAYVFSETVYEEEEEEIILFHVIEDKPMFMGGDPDVEFQRWVNSRIIYPPVAAENGIQGRVFVEFVIDTDGSLTDIRVTRSADPLLETEALRVLRQSPRWTPGRQRDRPVKVRYSFPFLFRLDN